MQQPGERDDAPRESSVQDRGSEQGQDALAAELSRLARALQREHDPHLALVAVVAAAVRLIPGCDAGSISVVHGRRRVWSEAASGQLPTVVDALQEQTGQGPCLDAVYHERTVRVEDMAVERRWPAFAALAARAGALSMLSLQLYVEGDTLGALNLYSRTAGAFDDASEHVAELFVAHASVAYATARELTGLATSVASRQLIGQAQGILMERHRIGAEEAFGRLVSASQHTNVKLRDVADTLVRTGELPAGG